MRHRSPARVPLLSYGSNRNPSKITWLRRALGLTGPVVVLRARTEGLAAVWASGFRARDGQRTSVLGAAPGASEQHAVWMATPDQVAVLDRCEGRGDRYRLARLGTGAVYIDLGDTDDGLRIEAPWCYLGLSAIRRPLLVDGRPVRCADLGQAAALELDGVPAPDDGLSRHHRAAAHRIPTTGPPRCSSTGRCNRGTRRGRWWRGTRSALRGAPPSPDACATPASATPRCSPTGRRRAPGWVVDVRDPAVLLRRLDRYEGPGVPADPGGRHARRRAADRLLDVRVGRRPGLADPAAPRLDRVIEVSQHETPVTVGAP